MSDRLPLIVIVGFIAVVVLAVIYAARSSRERATFVAKLAADSGWGYSKGRDPTLKQHLEALFTDEEFSPSNVVRVPDGARAIELFETTYSGRGRRNIKLGAGGVVASRAIRSDDPPVEIVAAGVLDTALLGNQVDLGDSTFAQHFIVQSRAPDVARRLMAEPLRALLARRAVEGRWPHVRIALGAGHVAFLISSLQTADDWHHAARFLRDVLEALER